MGVIKSKISLIRANLYNNAIVGGLSGSVHLQNDPDSFPYNNFAHFWVTKVWVPVAYSSAMHAQV